MTEHSHEASEQSETSAEPAAPAQPAAPAAWAWVKPQRQLQTVETEPLEYHRLLRGAANFRWWKPLLMLVLAGAYFGVFTILVAIIFVPLILSVDPGYLDGVTTGSVEIIDTQRPMSVLFALVSIAIMLPAVFLAMLTMGLRPTGRVWSAATKLRWGLTGRLFGAALVSLVVMNLVGIGLGILMNPASLSEPAAPAGDQQFDANAALLSMLFVVILVPFQSTAEEVVFRGVFMQVPGSLQRPGTHSRFRNPVARALVAALNSHWLFIAIPSIGFALAHIYDVWGMLAVGLMGVVAAWLTWKTGGLEAAIALHVVNNLIAFGFLASGFGGETAQTASSGGPESVISEAVGLALFVWLTLRVFARGGYGRSRIDLVQVPVAPGEGGPERG